MTSRSQPSGVGPSDQTAGLNAEPSAAWTPGPWSLATATCFIGDHQVPIGWTGVSGGNWFDFALVCTRLDDEPFDHPQGVANARLIASAPCLYEALRFYADPANWQDFIARPPGRDSHYHSAHAHLDKGDRARAALAKAEGKQ